jgi:periplasmic protein TonB
LSLVLTAAIIAATVAVHNDSREVTLEHPAIQIELAPEPVPPVEKAPEPPAPQPPKPRPVPKKASKREVAPAALPLMAATAEIPAPNDIPAPADDAEPAPPPRASSGTIEAQYAETLRTNIDARTVVPNSAEYRIRRPKGETRVNFTLDREGSILIASVAHGSGSDILDRQAVSIVRAGRYPPFPQTAFRGELRHSFSVTLEFNL